MTAPPGFMTEPPELRLPPGAFHVSKLRAGSGPETGALLEQAFGQRKACKVLRCQSTIGLDAEAL